MEKLLFAFLISFASTLILLCVFLPILKKSKAKQEILKFVEEHKSKSGTPTMGGITFLIAIAVTCIIMFGADSTLAYLSLAVTLGYGLVGFLDDFIKIYFKRNLGLRAYQKIVLQLGVATIVGLFVYNNSLIGGEFLIPFTQKTVFLGKWTIPFVIFIFLATTNGVNLTDGLDGLAASVTSVFMAFFAILLYVTSNQLNMSGLVTLSNEYFNLSLFAVIVFASLLAYLLFNVFPAKIFMGDTGSLGLGGAVACVAVLSKNSFLIPIIGVMFVTSVVSVILQVARYKISKKRVFLMAPYHHHLQMKGMSEPRIVCLYCVITIILGVLMLCV